MNFSIVSILLVTLFYVIYFLKQISLKREKIDANRLAKGSKSKKVVVIERFLLFFTYSTAFFQYLSIFHLKYMGQLPNIPVLKGVGIIIALSGILVFLLAVLFMKTNWRAGIDKSQKTELVTNGIYQYSRNPAFLGFDLFYIGIALISPSVLLTVTSIITIICLHLQILEEENYLVRTFGQSYLTYKNKVRRYL